MKHMLKLFSTVCTAAFLGSSVQAQSEDTITLSGWDANKNTTVSLQEWDTAIEEHDLFNDIDDNNNGIFDISEAGDSPFQYDVGMDLDDGGHVERQEFTVSLFNRYDANMDDMIDENEFGRFRTEAGANPSSTN